MLVLSRKIKEAEAVCIGDNVRIFPSKRKGNRVKFVIEAPRWMRVLRDELNEKKQADESQESSSDEALAQAIPEDAAKAEQLDPDAITRLVLSREVGETIEIDGVVLVKLLEIKGNTVRLGLEGPQEVPFQREKAA